MPDVAPQGVFAVADLHGAPSQDVGGAHKDGIADSGSDAHGFLLGEGNIPWRAGDAEPLQQRGEALAVLGKVDALRRCPQDAEAGGLNAVRQLQRRLPAQRDDDTVRAFVFEHIEHILSGERLEVELVCDVVVGGDGLGVGVHHDGLVARLLQGPDRVDRGVVKLHPWPIRMGPEPRMTTLGFFEGQTSSSSS